MTSSTGMLSLVRHCAPLRHMRFYPPHYPPPQDVAATMPFFMYPHLNEEQLAIQEKCKGDWKELTHDERVKIYRGYFYTTFAEQMYPPSYGMEVWGKVFWVLACVAPIYWCIKTFLLNPAPYQLHPDFQEQMRDRLDAMHKHPVWGPQAKYYDDDGNMLPREKEGY